MEGCRHSSVDSSAATILPPWVRVPSTSSTILSFIVKFVLYLSCEKNENKQKYGRVWPFKNIFNDVALEDRDLRIFQQQLPRQLRLGAFFLCLWLHRVSRKVSSERRTRTGDLVQVEVTGLHFVCGLFVLIQI